MTYSKEEFLQLLGSAPDSYEEYMGRLDEEQALRIRQSIRRQTHGLHAVAPLTCLGADKCPFFSACPIPNRDSKGQVKPGAIYPIGQPCILEYEFTAQKIADYLIHLDVEPSNPIELSIVNELALCDLLKTRALRILSTGDKHGGGRDLLSIDETITGYTDSGTALESRNTKIHPVAEYIDKIESRRQRWLDRLLETRKAKAEWTVKMGITEEQDSMLLELKKLQDFMSSMSSTVQELDAEWLPIDD
jgi:hypothetical protein